MTFVTGDLLNADQLNTYLRDNMNEMSPAKAQTLGSMIMTQDMNTVVERKPGSDFINTLDTTTATSYVDLSHVGPTVSVEISSSFALVFLYCHSYETGGKAAWMSCDVSGASASPAADNRAVQLQSVNGQRAGTCVMYSNLNPGVNVFTAKYRMTSSGTMANFSDRRLAVLPF